MVGLGFALQSPDLKSVLKEITKKPAAIVLVDDVIKMDNVNLRE